MFIVELKYGGYGASQLKVVEADSMEEATRKVRDLPEEEGDAMPCEIKINEEGVSQTLVFVW
jgi:hypothetical protein